MRLADYKKRVEGVMLSRVPRETRKGLQAWKYVNGRFNGGIVELAYFVPLGCSYFDLQRTLPALVAACGAPVELLNFAGVIVIQIRARDFPRTLAYSESLLAGACGLEIIVGYDRSGKPLKHSLRVPQLLIGGKSGYGKTDLERWILFQLIRNNSPEAVELWIVDLKGFSFLPFKDIPHVKRIARDLAGARLLLEEAARIMEARAREVWDCGDRSKAERFPLLLVLIDEAFQISPRVIKGKEQKQLAAACDEAAAKISGTGRETKVGLLYCTQRPDADVLNPLIKANIDCKICFKTETKSNSLVILDSPGAEKLPDDLPGRILYKRNGLKELQVPYIGDDDTWSELLKPWRVDHEQERKNFNVGAGDTSIFDGTSSDLFQGEWQPVKEGERDFENPGDGKMDRGQAAGDRQNKSLEADIDWKETFRNK